MLISSKPALTFPFLLVLFSIMMASSSRVAAAAKASKQLYILRHGQATHNPRAEAARSNGCSHEEFMELMRQDDSLDSELTDLGMSQARTVHQHYCANKLEGGKIQLVVTSPLSRALQTADLAIPFVKNRVCIEDVREINGWLLNAQRRTKSALQQTFPTWNFDALETEEDKLWTPELESQADCSERGYQGLCWLLERPEDSIFLVCHGGILRFTMNQHDCVKMVDGRTGKVDQDITARFGNCELRRYNLQWEDSDSSEKRRTVVLTELEHL